jgi:hypothetical protein
MDFKDQIKLLGERFSRFKIKKYLVVLNDQRKEVRHEIATLDDTFGFSEVLLKVLSGL